jgi:uncharacterized protein YpbB
MKPTCNAILLKVSKKVPKKSTVQETYELWVEKNSIADIATIRVLKQTIYAHFVQLIQTKAVSITEVLPEDKIQTLAQASKVTKRNRSMP